MRHRCWTPAARWCCSPSTSRSRTTTAASSPSGRTATSGSGLGDGGSGGDPLGNGQNPTTLLGDILRLDVSEPGRLRHSGRQPVRRRLRRRARGLPVRPPQPVALQLRPRDRRALDRRRRPERLRGGRPDRSGRRRRRQPRLEPDGGVALLRGSRRARREGLVLPLAEYGRDLGCSVTGGHVYRGAAIEGLGGWYLFGDYCTGLLFGIRSDAEVPGDGTALAPRILLESGRSISSFGTDSDGRALSDRHRRRRALADRGGG